MELNAHILLKRGMVFRREEGYVVTAEAKLSEEERNKLLSRYLRDALVFHCLVRTKDGKKLKFEATAKDFVAGFQTSLLESRELADEILFNIRKDFQEFSKNVAAKQTSPKQRVFRWKEARQRITTVLRQVAVAWIRVLLPVLPYVVAIALLLYFGKYVYDKRNVFSDRITSFFPEQKTAPTMRVSRRPSTRLEREKSISEIVEEWSAQSARIVCQSEGWINRISQSGSGFVLPALEGEAVAFTNRHVVVHDDADLACKVILFGHDGAYQAERMTFSKRHDFAVLHLSDSDGYLQTLRKRDVDFCAKGSSKLGERLILIGYPAVGSPKGITVTDGILSGRDAEYHITSATTEQGLSGGVAVLVSQDCYLGLQTAARGGKHGTFGLVLDITAFDWESVTKGWSFW